MSKEDKKYKIYKYTFPDNKIYIGKTSYDSVKIRLSNGYKPTTDVFKAIEKYGKENIDIVILHDNLTNESANILEREEINKHGGIENPMVLNAKEGGDIDCKLSSKTIEKLKQRYIENPELKEQISNQVKENYKKYPKMREAHMTSVRQFSIDGALIATYPSIVDASAATNINAGVICSCVNGLQITAGGFRWYPNNNKIYPILQYRRDWATKSVMRLDVSTGCVSALYSSITEAANANNVDRHTMSNYIKNNKIVNGNKFIYG